MIRSFQCDPSRDVQISAVQSLGNQNLIDFPDAIQVLIDALNEPKVNTPAIIALGKQKLTSHSKALETLLHIIQYELNP